MFIWSKSKIIHERWRIKEREGKCERETETDPEKWTVCAQEKKMIEGTEIC